MFCLDHTFELDRVVCIDATCGMAVLCLWPHSNRMNSPVHTRRLAAGRRRIGEKKDPSDRTPVSSCGMEVFLFACFGRS